MKFSTTPTGLVLVAFLLFSSATADFDIYIVYSYTYDCNTNVAHCVQMADGSSVQPASKVGAMGCPSTLMATDGHNTGQFLSGVGNGETELWYQDGMCRSPAPYYCYVDNMSSTLRSQRDADRTQGKWTCNDNKGGNVNCIEMRSIFCTLTDVHLGHELRQKRYAGTGTELQEGSEKSFQHGQ